MIFALFVATLVTTGSCMYSSSDDVIELTPNNFNNLVLNGDEVWFVEFYAPWCGHCQQLAPEWKKAATALKGVVKVGAVDADQHKSLGGQYGVQGFPTIKVFGLDKKSPTDYQGPRQASGIVDAGLNAASSMVKQRLSGKKGSGGGGGGSGGSSSGKKTDPDAVIVLTDSNFQEKVIDSEDIWLVEFFAPWCGHCKNLEPEWARAATELKGKVKLGALDATVNTVMANRYGVRGYPTIKYFQGGKKDGTAQDYDGGRTSSDIVSWAMTKVAENVPPPDVYEVTSQEVLHSNCDDRQLCIVSILPDILDCQSSCRNDYLNTIRAVGEHFKSKLWGWVWAEALAQPKLEQGLGLGGFGYPAMAAINTRKKVYAVLSGPFDQTGIKAFLRDLSYGKGITAPVAGDKLPEITTREPWDGKDGKLIVDEDIDLSDVDLDDLDTDSGKKTEL